MSETSSIERKFEARGRAIRCSKKKLSPSYRLPILWLLLAFVMLVLNYLPNNLIDPFSYRSYYQASTRNNKRAKTEQFNSEIAKKFNCVDDIVFYLKTHGDTGDKYKTLESAAFLLKHRFYHAYSIYTFQENWMAVLAGRFIWRDLSAKVIADDILKGNVAACSQVSIVFMNVCNKLGIPVRKVGLKGHFTLEAMIKKKWYFFDIDLKPDFKTIHGRKSMDEILRNKEQYALYQNTILDTPNIRRVFSQVQYGVPNIPPAPRAYLFHYSTKFLSHYGWLLPFYLFVIGMYKRKFSLKVQEIDP